MFLELPNLNMLLKQKSPSLPRNLALGTFNDLLTNSVLNKGESAIVPLFNGPVMLSSASDEAKLFAEVSLYLCSLLELI